MRISKSVKSVTSGSTIKAANSIKGSKYDQAIEHIKCAIDLLGSEAKTDVVARESIANLGVVMFDIKGNTQK